MLDAVPFVPVIAVGLPKVPSAPPSLKVTETPDAGLPFFVAVTVRAVGKVVPTIPD